MAKTAKTKTAFASPEDKAIVYLPISDIFPHPDNPRDDLGDLTELSESIKQNGIMQNLTVVPRKAGGYTVVIGHRRLAAARLAQLKVMPCIIADMTERQQHETMLAENMLRKDLTLANQVQAFEQLRLDGATAEEIAGTTGFSVKTVEKRLKYAEKIGFESLNNLEKSGKQVTLDDLDRVCSFTEPEVRERLIGSIGTHNFQFDCSAAEREVRQREIDHDLKVVLEGLRAKPIKEEIARTRYDTGTRKFIDKATFLKDPGAAIEGIPEDESLYYYAADIFSWFYLCIGEPADIDEVQKEAAEKRKQEEAKRFIEQEKTKKLEELFDTAYHDRWHFVNGLVSVDFEDDKKAKVTAEFIAWCALSISDYGGDVDYENMGKMFDIDVEKYDDYDKLKDEILKEVKGEAYDTDAFMAIAFKIAYVIYCDTGYMPFYSSRYIPERIEKLKKLYEYLERFDYYISDTERALLDGTHNLYTKDEED